MTAPTRCHAHTLFLIAMLAGSIFLVTRCQPSSDHSSATVTIGSKKFTESVILGHIVTQLIRTSGQAVTHRQELGGTRVLWNALLRGDIDVYPEYTGTLTQEIFRGEPVADDAALHAALAAQGLAMTGPLGFNNTYAIGMQDTVAARLGIRRISDLREHPALVWGVGNEFLNRGDGWPGLRAHYRLPHREVRGMDHDLGYRGLLAGDTQVIDLYSTDAEIAYYDLRALEDDAHFFPAYHAVLLYRQDLKDRAPAVIAALASLEGSLSEASMIALNAAVKLDRQPAPQVAAAFLEERLQITSVAIAETAMDRFRRYTAEHLTLVGISLFAAILVAIPLGILAYQHPRAGQVLLAVVGIIQTIPSLALLVFMIPLLGIGGPPAVAALFLYSLLPIVRNTYTGLHDISPAIRESAAALGLPTGTQLRLIELPLAARSILGGIKTSAVINVGTATLGALIGAGGYGQPILTGIRLDDTGLILQGAVPAAALALLAQGVFEVAERVIVPRGLRLEAGR